MPTPDPIVEARKVWLKWMDGTARVIAEGGTIVYTGPGATHCRHCGNPLRGICPCQLRIPTVPPLRTR